MRPITELDEMKSIQIGIMQSIHQFCTKNNITYYLSHGTLIGAIRHQGFIPWDDDIDIFMAREDYERFCDEFPKVQDNVHLKLANSRTSPFYGRPMSKVFDTRTNLIEPNYLFDDPIGVNVDIWPLDGAPEDKEQQRRRIKKIKIMQYMLYGRIVKFYACHGITQKLAHVFLLPFSARKILERYEAVLRKYPYSSSEIVSCYVDPYKKFYKKEWFGEAKECKFGDNVFLIPNDADKILTQIYGDYMKLPPLEKQIPHHVANAYWL